jgi:hypothetical protein
MYWLRHFQCLLQFFSFSQYLPWLCIFVSPFFVLGCAMVGFSFHQQGVTFYGTMFSRNERSSGEKNFVPGMACAGCARGRVGEHVRLASVLFLAVYKGVLPCAPTTVFTRKRAAPALELPVNRETGVRGIGTEHSRLDRCCQIAFEHGMLLGHLFDNRFDRPRDIHAGSFGVRRRFAIASA